MPYHVVFTSLADADLDSIINYIAADNPVRAISFVEELRDRAVRTLSTTPKAGSIFDTVRVFTFGSYVLVYDVDEAAKTVIIHMIAHGSRQWREIITQRLP